MTKMHYKTLEERCEEVITDAMERVSDLIAEEADIAVAEHGCSEDGTEQWVENWFNVEYEIIHKRIVEMIGKMG